MYNIVLIASLYFSPARLYFSPVIRGPPVFAMLNLSFSEGLFFDRLDRPISACVLYTWILSKYVSTWLINPFQPVSPKLSLNESINGSAADNVDGNKSVKKAIGCTCSTLFTFVHFFALTARLQLRGNGRNIFDQQLPTLLGVVESVCTLLKVWAVSNFAQQLPTTGNDVKQGVQTYTQHLPSNNIGSCWPTMLRPFAQGFTT